VAEGIIFCSPLRVRINKNKMFTLGLNQYRNSHFQVLNKAKKAYKLEMSPQLIGLPVLGTIETVYTLYPKTKHLCDLDNILSIHAKFFQDCLTENRKIEDDNYLFIKGLSFRFGGVEPDNPRVEIEVKRLDK